MILKEIKSLTGIRGIAALYVAIGHFFDKTNLLASLPDYLKPIFSHYGLSVDLFFILSAYLLILTCYNKFKNDISIKEYFRFMAKRFGRIYPLYFFSLTFVFVVIYKFSFPGDYFKGLTLVLSLNGFRETLFVLWSLRAEWITYLLFPMAIFITSRLKPNLMIVLLMLCFLLFCNYNLYNFSSGVQGLLRCWFDYGLGIAVFYISNASKNPKANKFKHFDLLILFLIPVMMFVNNGEPFIIILFALLIFLLVKHKSFFSHVLEYKLIYYLGLISYSIYLVHPVCIYYIKYFQVVSGYGVFFLYLITLILISGLTYKYVEVKGMAFIQRAFVLRNKNVSLQKQGLN